MGTALKDRNLPYCPKCGGQHRFGCKPRSLGGIDWKAVMAYQVQPGVEMRLEDIGKIAGCSRERVRQIEFAALRKLANRAAVKRVCGEVLRV